MDGSRFLAREDGRAQRLVAFVQGEVREMCVHARFAFTEKLLAYLKPEIEELARNGKFSVGARHEQEAAAEGRGA